LIKLSLGDLIEQAKDNTSGGNLSKHRVVDSMKETIKERFIEAAQ
jgi:hypothetical protein